MTLLRLREDELVDRLRSIVEDTTHAAIRIGIGDDAAVWQPSRSHRSVVTTDALVEGVHFTRKTMSLEDVGWRTAAANLSDLAAMGARPVLAIIALGVPPDTDAEQLLALYRGIAACSQPAGLAVVGGDLVRAPALTIAMTAIGEVRASNVKTRAGGRRGNILAVTGPLGASRAGLDLARGAVVLKEESLREEALRAHRRPQARVREGRRLAASANVRAMMDCSDGLSTDLARLCKASGVGARVEEVPVAGSAVAVAQALGEDARAYALAGGEDFELIVAIEARAFAHVAARFAAHFGRPLYRVGVLRSEPGVFLVDDGAERPLPPTGWDHFSNAL
ncbi:MAG TPA: thiamine-phosphate kinase [Candidatus Tyrphobacter sp.]